MKKGNDRSEEIGIAEGIDGDHPADQHPTRLEPGSIDTADTEIGVRRSAGAQGTEKDSRAWIQYFVVPAIFLLVALLGGLRIGAAEAEFLFLKPSLICLIFALILIVLFARAGILRIGGWFSEDFTPTLNTANAGVMITLFAASAQVFNSLLPEQGLPFWIVGFFFLWSLWTNLFAQLDARKLLASLGSLFTIAFITKYVVLVALTAPGEGGFVSSLVSGNLTREAVTYMLDLPRFSPATAYIQFFTILLFLAGLYMLPSEAKGIVKYPEHSGGPRG